MGRWGGVVERCGVNGGDLGVEPRRRKIEKTRMKLFGEGQDRGGGVGGGEAGRGEGVGVGWGGVMALINKCRQRLDSKEGRPTQSGMAGTKEKWAGTIDSKVPHSAEWKSVQTHTQPT